MDSFLDRYFAQPRVDSLAVSPDGGRVVGVVRTPREGATRSALWELGDQPRRLTWSAEGEDAPAYLCDGSLLFLSGRPFPGGAADQGGLWMLPPGGGEARPVVQLPGGVLGMAVARDAPVVVVATSTYEGAADAEASADKLRRRRDAGLSAVLSESYPVRAWSQSLGPCPPRLVRVRLDQDPVATEDLTPDAGTALASIYGTSFAVSPDGEKVVVGWRDPDGGVHAQLHLVEIHAGQRRVLSVGGDHAFPSFSPDGRWIAVMHRPPRAPSGGDRMGLRLVDLVGGSTRDVAAECPGWPLGISWAPDSTALYFTAESDGRRPLWRLDVATGQAGVLVGDASFTGAVAARDAVYALRSTLDEPEHPVRIEVSDGSARPLPVPFEPLRAPGRVSEIRTTADDGVEIRSWLVLPPTASAAKPAPLVVLLHGGPPGTWAGWNWQWNPHHYAAAGYAVVLPDPGQSVGYGPEFARRGWADWGGRIAADVLCVVDDVLRREDIDGERVAGVGNSFGGYMVNWLAGHTDRFAALVNYSGIWSLEGLHRAADLGVSHEFEFGDPYADASRFAANSPHCAAAKVRTPMLVTHGERDYRVPVEQALHQWTDLQHYGVPSKLLLFPDESHGIGRLGNLRVWYETVLAFLAEHVRGEKWQRPDLL